MADKYPLSVAGLPGERFTLSANTTLEFRNEKQAWNASADSVRRPELNPDIPLASTEQPQSSLLFVGDALDEIRELPDDAQDRLGYAMGLLQAGMKAPDMTPLHGKQLSGIGELRARSAVPSQKGAYRMLYVHTGARLVMTQGGLWTKATPITAVLHCFQKKTEHTPQRNLDIAVQRRRMLESAFVRNHRYRVDFD